MARYYEGKGSEKERMKYGQISESMNDFANMPQEKKHMAYPKMDYGLECDYRDNIEGIDKFAKQWNNTVKKQKRTAEDA